MHTYMFKAFFTLFNYNLLIFNLYFFVPAESTGTAPHCNSLFCQRLIFTKRLLEFYLYPIQKFAFSDTLSFQIINAHYIFLQSWKAGNLDLL